MWYINVDVRFYHVGVPQLKKKFIFITLTTLFSKKNIKFKVALRPRLGLSESDVARQQ
jgi:hypothetical protein